MINQFHAIYERDGDWYVASCPEVPGANGIGKTQEECKENLKDAIRLILQDMYENSLQNQEMSYYKELITIE